MTVAGFRAGSPSHAPRATRPRDGSCCRGPSASRARCTSEASSVDSGTRCGRTEQGLTGPSPGAGLSTVSAGFFMRHPCCHEEAATPEASRERQSGAAGPRRAGRNSGAPLHAEPGAEKRARRYGRALAAHWSALHAAPIGCPEGKLKTTRAEHPDACTWRPRPTSAMGADARVQP